VAQFLLVSGARQTWSAKEALRPSLAIAASLACLLSSSCATAPAPTGEPEPPKVVVTADKAPTAAGRVGDRTDRPRTAISKIDPTLLVAGPGVAKGESQHVMIGLEKTPPTPEEAELIRELRGGAARFGDERMRIESLLLAHRQTRIRAQQEPLREFIESIGGTVLWEARASFGLDASLTRAMILQLAELPDVVRLDADHRLVESAHPE